MNSNKLDNREIIDDPNAVSRKKDHISLAFESQINSKEIDNRFYYEPFLAAHPDNLDLSIDFLGKKMLVPIWISSMTGGTEKAKLINRNLAKNCREFGMGMGLGSCRSLLYSDEYFEDFNVRPIIGSNYPLFANLGVAQVEHLVLKKELHKITTLIDKLQADGLIIHVNPFQEYLQPEGDRFIQSPLQTIENVLEKLSIPIIVKEVGQGFGPQSLRRLLQLPLAAIDFGASGGTNFALLELLRTQEKSESVQMPLTKVGHSAEEMITFVNDLVVELGDKVLCNQIIVSGGIQNFLDGYYCTKKLKLKSVYGQASAFLKYAIHDDDSLSNYTQQHIKGLKLANAYLIPK
ncbi:MAG: type 2 isopentenyl-diphosphate Delta-isomerase [Saprospiraceae bacterium]|nr:type 2 isopentenyl-diphosphate Delta-isomerase [Saprospiraceae bacterium]